MRCSILWSVPETGPESGSFYAGKHSISLAQLLFLLMSVSQKYVFLEVHLRLIELHEEHRAVFLVMAQTEADSTVIMDLFVHKRHHCLIYIIKLQSSLFY